MSTPHQARADAEIDRLLAAQRAGRVSREAALTGIVAVWNVAYGKPSPKPRDRRLP